MSSILHALARKFSREDYYKMGEAGVFGPTERVELIEGDVIRMTPQNWRHGRAISNVRMRVGDLG